MKISARFLLVFALAASATIFAVMQGRTRTLRSGGGSEGQPRTAWGAPDLQGIWNTNTFVPLERPMQYGTRGTMTEEEHAKALADLQDRNKRPGRDSRDVGGKPGQGHRERTSRARITSSGSATSRPSSVTVPSMVTDPPDGRIPPLTPRSGQAHRGQARISRCIAAGNLRRPPRPDLAAPQRPVTRLQPRSHQPLGRP
jgi:hypothetical protein